jgi:hypothetical protein
LVTVDDDRAALQQARGYRGEAHDRRDFQGARQYGHVGKGRAVPTDDAGELAHGHRGYLRDADRVSHQDASLRIRSFRLDVRVEVDKDPLADLANIFAARA